MTYILDACAVIAFLRDEPGAEVVVDELRMIGLLVREDMDREFWEEAGKFKSALRRISLADCFSIALARRVNGELVTSDHHEFDQVAQQGICRLLFIR